MGFYLRIYTNLCDTRKQLLSEWKPKSGLHRHHIIPKHTGGCNDDSNYSYLSVREHIIAHFLLWKIYGNPNDLRSMKMLGAKLTYQQRRITGIFCRDNKIGIFGAPKEERLAWARLGLEKQKTIPNSWYYWTTPEGRRRRSILGGMKSGKKQSELKIGMFSTEVQRRAASMGGKSHRGKKCMHKPGETSFIRVLPNDVDVKIKDGYILGYPISPRKGVKTNVPSVRRRLVSDGTLVYNSVHEAAVKNNITPSAVVHRCKSKKSTWAYI